MNEGPKKPTFQRLGNPDQVYNERKAQIFQALQQIVAQEKAKDPNFNLTRKKLDELVTANRDMFPQGINTGAAVMNYWQAAGFDYLQEKLGLPVTGKKRKEDY
jgi:hypothetical protein